MNRTLRHRRRRESNVMKTISAILLAAVALLFIINILFGMNTVNGDVEAFDKGYIPVTVEKGDTLWDIANDHMDANFYDHDTYIEEIVNINDLVGKTIYAGEQIMIPVIATTAYN